VLDDIKAVATDDALVGALRLGIVPTALANLLPPALAALKAEHPALHVEVRTGLSGELALKVRDRDLDVAVLTAPSEPMDGLTHRVIGRELVYVLAPRALSGQSEAALLGEQPFIWFNRKTWAGQQIEARLATRKIAVKTAMEVDSLEALEAMVRHGLGVAVTPLRLGQKGFSDDLFAVPFCAPQAERALVMLERQANPRRRLATALFNTLAAYAGAGHQAS